MTLATDQAQPVVVSRIVHRYGDAVAVDDVSLTIESGEFLTLLGASGSGKTTLLRIIAGLTRQTSGTVSIGDRDVTSLPPQRRGVGMVFQNYALFPHMTVEQNVSYPLSLRRMNKAELTRRVDEALARVNLGPFRARKPAALSGGQQQRVAVARALVYEPSVILMDEPLGALDRQLRRHMQIELRDLQKQLGTTCVLVTHDQEEALTMSDRVGVMSRGKLLQLDTPTNLYRSPVNDVVANFIGDTNFFEGARDSSAGSTRVAVDPGCRIPVAGAAPDGARLVVGVRPEFVRIGAPDPGADAFTMKAEITETRFLGSIVELAVRTDNDIAVTVRMSLKESLAHGVGDRITIWWLLEDQTVHVPTPGAHVPGEEPALG